MLGWVEVLLRRNRRSQHQELQLKVGDLSLDLVAREARRGDREIELLPMEFELLEFMMRNQGVVLRRDSLIDAVWGYERTVENNTLDVFMKQLRTKIDDGAERKLIHTVRGFGYKLAIEAEP